MKIEIKSEQIIDDKKETMIQKGIGKVEEHAKGTVITWKTIEDNQTYQMTILENKILLKKPNQAMIFEKDKKTKSELQTPYGVLSMNLTTTHMEIIGQNEQIQKIVLHYEIELDGTKPYQNQIEINIG